MTAWILLPVSLSAFSITGLWTVYAMAVMNRHVCPVENWYGVLCRQLHSKAPFISVPSWAGAAASQTETLGHCSSLTLARLPPGPTTSPALLTLLSKGVPKAAAPWTMSPSSASAAHIPQRVASSASLATWVLSWWPCSASCSTGSSWSRVGIPGLTPQHSSQAAPTLQASWWLETFRWIMLSLYITSELVWPSPPGCCLSACTVSSPTMEPPPPRTWLWPTCGLCWPPSPLSSWSSAASSSSTRALSCSTEQPCASGCLSSTSSFSTAPSAMSLGQSPQRHWWLRCSLLAGPSSPPGAVAPPLTSTVPLRASP